MVEGLKYWLGFNLVKGIGPTKLQALLNHFGSLESAWLASETEWQRIGLDRRATHNLRAARDALNLDLELQRVYDLGISLLTWESEAYPGYLREIPNAPPLLYVQGTLSEADYWSVAVVGTRRLSTYGRQVTAQLVDGLVRNGVTIVSGLARGIDGVAHHTALEAGGRTIAVLGSGLDHIYPPENRKLARRMIESERGVLVSEYGLGVRPEAKNFPPRNRIISGLSLGTLVVEAGRRSGALITAEFALDQDRDVFAVPGNVTSPISQGPNRLIQEGAKLVSGVDDILEELNIHMVADKVAVQLALPESAEEAVLLSLLSGQPSHIDELSRESGLTSPVVSSTLTMMELKGMVQQVGGMQYVLAREPGPVYETDAPAE
jgi:DNA processing protein